MTMIKGVLFDKDGTLFDFAATWEAWAASFLPGWAVRRNALAAWGPRSASIRMPGVSHATV